MSENLVIAGVTFNNVAGIKATDTSDNTVTYMNDGSANDNLRKMFMNTLTEYVDDDITSLSVGSWGSNFKTFKAHNVTSYAGIFNGSYVEYLAFPKLNDAYGAYLFRAQRLKGLDVKIYRLATNTFYQSAALTTLVLRYATAPVTLQNTNAFGGTPFASGGTGGTIYIPKVLYDHLGDGTSMDYKAQTNWSTVNGWGTITWAKIEGSAYENTLIDGDPIPTT